MRTLLALACLAGLASFASAQPADTAFETVYADARERYSTAYETLVQSGDMSGYETARTRAEQALEAAPGEAEQVRALRLLAEIALSLGDWDQVDRRAGEGLAAVVGDDPQDFADRGGFVALQANAAYNRGETGRQHEREAEMVRLDAQSVPETWRLRPDGIQHRLTGLVCADDGEGARLNHATPAYPYEVSCSYELGGGPRFAVVKAIYRPDGSDPAGEMALWLHGQTRENWQAETIGGREILRGATSAGALWIGRIGDTLLFLELFAGGEAQEADIVLARGLLARAVADLDAHEALCAPARAGDAVFENAAGSPAPDFADETAAARRFDTLQCGSGGEWDGERTFYAEIGADGGVRRFTARPTMPFAQAEMSWLFALPAADDGFVLVEETREGAFLYGRFDGVPSAAGFRAAVDTLYDADSVMAAPLTAGPGGDVLVGDYAPREAGSR